MLHIETIRSAPFGQANWEEKPKETSDAIGSSCTVAVPATKPVASFDWYIFVRGARLLRSLVPVKQYFGRMHGHMEMDSSLTSSVAIGDRECAQGIRKPNHYLYARDVIFEDHLQAIAANEGAIWWMWTCPPALVIQGQLHPHTR